MTAETHADYMQLQEALGIMVSVCVQWDLSIKDTLGPANIMFYDTFA